MADTNPVTRRSTEDEPLSVFNTAWPDTFLRLCELFDLQADWVRQVVCNWLQAGRRQARRPSVYRHAA